MIGTLNSALSQSVGVLYMDWEVLVQLCQSKAHTLLHQRACYVERSDSRRAGCVTENAIKAHCTHEVVKAAACNSTSDQRSYTPRGSPGSNVHDTSHPQSLARSPRH